jgi:8-amino-7-oxononanoate synthase
VTAQKRVTLDHYARRRFVLSGTAVVKDHYPYCQSPDGITASKVLGAKTLQSFAHYDYLDLGADQRVKAAAVASIEAGGVGAHASRLVGGELGIHRALEDEIAAFLEVDSSLALVSGYGTNVALVSHLLTGGDVIFVDEACHNSLMVGTQLSRAEVFSFPHNDVDALARLLEQNRPKYGRALLIIEGLYSMDGDIPDLPRMLKICRAHNVWVLVDEAHSIGVLGANGRGIAEHYGIPPSDIDLIVGTLSKAFVTCGGFIAAKSGIIEWLRYTLPGFVYSVGMPPPNAAAAITALRVLKKEPERLALLHDNSRYFLEGARRRGLNVGSAVGAAVVPILFEDVPQTIGAANALLEAGYYVPPIVQIAVPKDAPRIRFFITAGHTHEQIDGALDTLQGVMAGRPPAEKIAPEAMTARR